MRSRSAWLVLLLTIALGLGADLATKYIAFAQIAPNPVTLDKQQIERVIATDVRTLQALIPQHEPVTVIENVLDFQLVLNAGAVFGTGQGKRGFFIGFTIVALVFALYLFARHTSPRERVAHIAVGLVIAGGLGNLYDRLKYACVRDFIHPLPGVEWPFVETFLGRREIWPYVSNVADALLLIGIFALVVKLWREEPGEGGAREKERAGEG
jgi:signal peptidase II